MSTTVEDEEGGKSPRSRSPVMGVAGLLREHQNKGGSEDEGRRGSGPGGTGILRLDPAKPRRSSAASVEFKTDKDDPSSPCPSDRLSVTWADGERSVSSDGASLAPRTPVSSDQPSINTLIPACGSLMEEPAEDDEFSASVSAILKRSESRCSRRGSRRRKRRRTSTMTSSSTGDGSTVVDMEGEEVAETLRIHKEVLAGVKYQSWPIGRKLRLVRSARSYIERHEGELEERLAQSTSTKDVLLRCFIRARRVARAGVHAVYVWVTGIEPWQGRIKTIESYFGSAVASYFTFLRWVLGLNIALTAFLTAFVIIPEFLAADKSKAGERKTLLPGDDDSAYDFKVMWDFEGMLRYSPIFYGYYSKTPKTREGYRLPLAYFLTSVAVYAYSFVAILRKMAANSRMSKLADDDESTFTWKVLAGWDFTIGNPEAAQNKVASINTGLREALLEAKESEKEDENWKVKAKRVLAHLIVLGLIVASAYAVVLLVERSKHADETSSWFRQNELTIILTLISLIYPNLFDLVGLLEERHPRNQLQWQLARIMALNLLNLYTLIFALFSKVYEMTSELSDLKANLTSSYGNETTSSMVGTTPMSLLNDSNSFNWSSSTPDAFNFSLYDNFNSSLYATAANSLANLSDPTWNLTGPEVNSLDLVTTLSSTLIAALTVTGSSVANITAPRCRRIRVSCPTSTPSPPLSTRLPFEIVFTDAPEEVPLTENATWIEFGGDNMTDLLPKTDSFVDSNDSFTGLGNGTVFDVDDEEFPYAEYYVDDKVYLSFDYFNTTGDVSKTRNVNDTLDGIDSESNRTSDELTTAEYNETDSFEVMDATEIAEGFDDMMGLPDTTEAVHVMELPWKTENPEMMENPEVTDNFGITENPPNTETASEINILSTTENPGVTEDMNEGAEDEVVLTEFFNALPAMPGLNFPRLLIGLTDSATGEINTDAEDKIRENRIIRRKRKSGEEGSEKDVKRGVRERRVASIDDYGGVNPVDMSYRTMSENFFSYEDYEDPSMAPSEEYNVSNNSALFNGTVPYGGNFTIESDETTTASDTFVNRNSTYWDKLLADINVTELGNEELTTTTEWMETTDFTADYVTEFDGNCYKTVCDNESQETTDATPTASTSFPTTYLPSTPTSPPTEDPTTPTPTPTTPTTEATTEPPPPTAVTPPFLDEPMKNNPEKWASRLTPPARQRLRKLCWETMFGQEIIKLTVMDLVVTVVTIVIGDYIRAVIVRLFNGCCCWDLEKKFPGYPDFKIAENILHLVNNQGMIWMGMFFSPGLPALNILKLVIVLYVRSWAVVTSNVPPETVFKASNNNNFYLLFLLTMLFLCTLPVGYAVVWVEPSWHCGPFSDFKRMYKLATYTLIGGLPSSLYPVVDYISSPGVVIPAGLLLVLIIYYLLSLTTALREANSDLRDQLRQERSAEKRKAMDARSGKNRSETPLTKWGRVVPLTPMPRQRLDGTSGPEKSTSLKSPPETDVPPALPSSEVPREKDEGAWPDDVTDLGHSEVFDDSLSETRKQGKETPVKDKPSDGRQDHRRHEKDKDKDKTLDYDSAPRSPYSRAKHRHNSYPQGARDEDKVRSRRENHRAAAAQNRALRKSQERKQSDESSHRESPTKPKSNYRHGIVDSPRSRRRKGSSGQTGKLKDKMPEECVQELNEVIHTRDSKKKKSVEKTVSAGDTEAASRPAAQSRHRREPSIFKMDDIRRNSNEKTNQMKASTPGSQRRSSSDDSQSMQSIPVIKISKEDSVERYLEQARLERQARTVEDDEDDTQAAPLAKPEKDDLDKPKPIETNLDEPYGTHAELGTTSEKAALISKDDKGAPTEDKQKEEEGKEEKEEEEPAGDVSSDEEATLLDNN